MNDSSDKTSQLLNNEELNNTEYPLPLDSVHSNIDVSSNGSSSSDENDEKCSICLSKIGPNDDKKELNCGHIYHKTCVHNWIRQKRNCPNCRSPEIGPTNDNANGNDSMDYSYLFGDNRESASRNNSCCKLKGFSISIIICLLMMGFAISIYFIVTLLMYPVADCDLYNESGCDLEEECIWAKNCRNNNTNNYCYDIYNSLDCSCYDILQCVFVGCDVKFYNKSYHCQNPES